MAVIFLFIDGVGLGEEESQNPFFRHPYRAFRAMAGERPFSRGSGEIYKNGHLFKGIDATLGVEGLPQSGTGQTTLFTGINAAQKIGKHFGPFPHSGIKPFLRQDSIFKKIGSKGKSGCFMNAYPDLFFQKAQEKNRWSCTTLMTKSADIRLHTEEDVRKGRAVTAEITQQAWREMLDIDVPEISEEEASSRLLGMAEEKDFVLYEYYLTDKAGHAQNAEKAEEVIGRFDRFLMHLIDNRREQDTLILSSDHGNVEDLSVKTHTLNRVPLFVMGPGAGHFREVNSIQGVTPAIVEIV